MILDELSSSNLEDDVDDAVQVLLDAGISSPTLRDLAARVGTLRQAGYVNWSALMMTWSSILYIAVLLIAKLADEHADVVRKGFCEDTRVQGRCHGRHRLGCEHTMACKSLPERYEFWLALFGVLQAVSFVFMVVMARNVRRAFNERVLVRIGLSFSVFIIFLGVLLFGSGALLPRIMCWFGVAPVVFILMAAGPVRIAHVPCIGMWLVRFLMTPISLKSCQRRFSGRALN